MKLVVVGGVAAGASAAARARRLDENSEIIILERGQHVSFANCGLPYHIGGSIKERSRLLLQTPQSLQAMLNLDVRVGHEVTAIDREARKIKVKELETGREYEEPYDKLVLCPGASPIRPNLPGIDHPGIFILRNVDDMDRIKAVVDGGAKRALVIGGGYIGVEMAESLRERGLEVDLVEMADQIMTPLDQEMARDLETHMRWHGVRLHLGVAAAAFRDDGGKVAVELVDGRTLSADLVLLSAGVRPESDLARAAGLEIGAKGGIKVDEHLRTSDPDIYAAGDAVEVTDTVTGAPAQIPLAGPANRQGRAVADNLFGRDSIYTTTQGTAIVKVFDMTGGATGASEKTLNAAGQLYEKVYIHPSGHAGYYPGTATMHIKLLFAPEDGKILGAQVVGYDGVDKRLDVFATALRAGMTVYDLEHLELAYAPPYGSAKDPINMAGFVAANVLKEDINLWHPEDYPDKTNGGLLLDVRTPHEFDVWHIPGSVNIPIGELRGSLDQMPKDRPIFTYCKVGFRSYLAYRILIQTDFSEVYTLSGGTLTFCMYHGTGVCTGEPEPPVVSYAEEKTAGDAIPTGGQRVDLDVCGLQCPGPIRKLVERMDALDPGDELTVTASDLGFASDAPAWCKSKGHDLLEVKVEGKLVTARIRKGGTAPILSSSVRPAASNKKTMVVFSADLDKMLAAFIIANGAASMGDEVTMFFTFWGLNVLRKKGPQASGKGLLDRMFGWMMPKGSKALKLSKMNMMGVGTSMMKHVMKAKNVEGLPDLIAAAQQSGVKLVACTMSMEVMGIQKEELIDGVEPGGVAAFLGESNDANMTLFI